MSDKTILVDLDGVCYPWVQQMATLLAYENQVDYNPDELIKLYNKWEVWENWGMSKNRFNWLWAQYIKDGRMYRGKVNKYVRFTALPGAIEGLWNLSDADWDIHIVTARLNKFRLHDQSILNTVKWLREEGLPYRKISFSDDKHAILGEAIVDDQAKNLIDHPAPMRFLFPAPHNMGERESNEYVTLDAINPWDELVELLLR